MRSALWSVLVRFDTVYYLKFKCNLRRVVDYPNLRAYARDLYQRPGFGETVDFDHIKRHYYGTHLRINPTGNGSSDRGLHPWSECVRAGIGQRGRVNSVSTDHSVGIFYSWWRDDDFPTLSSVPDLAIAELDSDDPGIDLALLTPQEMARLRSDGNRLYVARIGGDVVGWGWNATVAISIGELRINRPLPPGSRYLWGFVTLPHWRGKGVYPHLLQEILRQDTNGERFWIGHEDGNRASARGILKAGFTPTGEVFQSADGSMRLVPSDAWERSAACVDVFGVPIGPASDE